MFNKNLIFILYDGIRNSIFVSQVLQPILQILKEDKKVELTLISFEKNRPSNDLLKKLIPAHDRLHFALARKLPFYGISSLTLAKYQLKNLFKIIKVDKIIARGPLAGFIGIQAIKEINKENKYKINKHIPIIIQARGLAAEEYRFTNENKKENIVFIKIKTYIYKQLKKIENQVYKKCKCEFISKEIEAVSPALKKYLIINFNAPRQKIRIATKDIPPIINKQKRNEWRKIIRSELNIKNDQPVYCYSGSYKPWQCIPESIEYFYKQYHKNHKSFLLLLSPDKEKLKNLLKYKKISKSNYALLNVDIQNLIKYLSASDIGLLFREKDIINWVSRPTKMLEYQAAGLKIIHNQTIAWLE